MSTSTGVRRRAREPFAWLPVPSLSARALGVFRVVFGALLLIVLYKDPPLVQPLELQRNYSWLADWSWVHALTASARGCRVLHQVTLGLAVLFVAGLWTRLAYTGLVIAIFIGRLVDLQQSGTHNWDLPLLTLVALGAVPWGDGFSLDALLRRRSMDQWRAGRQYGLALWIPAFALGLAYAAAAYAKLTNGGLAWITSGAVRYHFVEDAPNAPFTWGLWIAAHPTAAVLLSLGAVVVEAVFILAAFVRSMTARLAFGTIGITLCAAFYIFQGVLWLPWLVLFTVFLPWELLDRGRAVPSESAGLRAWHVAIAAALALQQVVASATSTQIEPLISDYAMYSGTFDSPEHFERSRYRKLQRLVFELDGADVTERVESIQNAPEDLLDAAEDLAQGHPLDDGLVGALAGFRAEYRARYRDDPVSLTVVAERVPFDWERGVFRPPSRIRISEVPLPRSGGAVE